MSAYYNEIDLFDATWLRELIAAGHIADGVVDERSIEDVLPAELLGFTQCHFFAGIGGWSASLRLAGWPDDRPVWTGSCPCQPFSAAGKRGGTADERHLWPAFHHLIRSRRPAVVLGEQVASPDGLGWWDLVCDDLDAAGYAGRAVDLGAAGVGAPHIRQRLWWVAESTVGRRQARYDSAKPRSTGGMVDGKGGGCGERRDAPRPGESRHADGSGGLPGGLADGDAGDARAEGLQRCRKHRFEPHDGGAGFGYYRPGPLNGIWRDADWLLCRDGRWRPVRPGTQPLVDGLPGRVGPSGAMVYQSRTHRLRGYGNAIVPQVACEVIRTYMETDL